MRGVVEIGQLLRIRDGQGTEPDGVDQLEDGGVGADAEREREHGDQGEHGVEAKLAETVADVGGIAIHETLECYTPREGNGYARCTNNFTSEALWGRL